MLQYSVWSNYFYDLTPEERILRFLECGFSSSELSDEDGAILLSRGTSAGVEFRRFADAHGFSFPQGHLYLRADICESTSVDTLKKWLDLFSMVGVRSAVLHAAGGETLSDEERFARRTATLAALCTHIKGSEMTIFLENLITGVGMPKTSSELLAYIDTVNSPHLGICLDTGHLNVARRQSGVTETQREFILRAGKHLRALHIADNDGSYDQHMMPYGRGRVEWGEVMQALREIGYSGLFNLEIPGESGGVPLPIRTEKLKYVKKLCEWMLGDR